jgi:hypothetical protein
VKTLLLSLSLLGLALVIAPPCLAFGTGAGLTQAMKNLMLAGTLLWFATATPLAGLRQGRTAATNPAPPPNR